VISVRAADRAAVEKAVAGAPFALIGRTGGPKLSVTGHLDLPLRDVAAAWRNGFRRVVE